jgi:hypothetical protein
MSQCRSGYYNEEKNSQHFTESMLSKFWALGPTSVGTKSLDH